VPVDRQPLLFASPGRTAEPRQPPSPRIGPTRRRDRGVATPDARRHARHVASNALHAAWPCSSSQAWGHIGADDRTSYGTPFDGAHAVITDVGRRFEGYL